MVVSSIFQVLICGFPIYDLKATRIYPFWTCLNLSSEKGKSAPTSSYLKY
jgi:hypothetical protein